VASNGSSGSSGKGSGGKSSGGKDSAGGEGGASDTGGKFSRAGSAGKGGSVSDGGAGGDAGGGGEGGAIEVGTPPTVTILSPDAVTDPLGGKVLVKDSVDVTCKAVAGEGPDAAAVDPASVKIAVLSSDGSVVVSEKDALASTATEYTATIPLTGVTTGKVILRCTARSLTKALGTDTKDTLADRGPTITLTEPILNAKLALKEPLKVLFTALPTPVTPSGDTQAQVDKVVLTLNGVEQPTTAKGGGAYEASINMEGPEFTPKPNGVTNLAITAMNKRAPEAASATLVSTVSVDGAGPVIKVTSPVSAEVVGGTVKVTFSVTDAGSGVNADLVKVTINGKDNQYENSAVWVHNAGSDSYTFLFDSRTLPTTTVQLPIEVNAQDNVGNEASSVSIPVYFDLVGPKVDLDPANIRTFNSNNDCSVSFDPVGVNNMNDLTIGSGQDYLRVMVWDLTNQKPGSASTLYLSGVNPAPAANSVRLFFRNPNDEIPLLSNSLTPGTGICDQIKDTTVNGESVPLTALTPNNNPWYGGESAIPPLAGACKYIGGNKPMTLCNNNSALWQVIGQFEGDAKDPAIYAYSPTPNVDCTGQSWTYDTFISAANTDGWVCLGASAKDRVGNVGVSPPLRLCVTGKACSNSSIAPPSCTDGCTPPGRGGGFLVELQ
jgi:hypothetical protein